MRILFIILVSLYSGLLYASSPFIKEAEDAILEIHYSRRQVLDTTSRDDRYCVDDVMLRIGNDKSLFCGVKKLWEDSISRVDYPTYSALLKAEYEKDKKNFFFLGGRYWTYLYKDRARNEVTECDYFNMTHWRYRESMQVPKWEITDSIKDCLGYECVMATTFFKGRNWTAWFAPEIPVSDGPWKLCGLPGLILEAYDEAHDYEFTPTAIYTSGIGPVGYMGYTPEEDYIDVSRDKFFKEWRKSNLRDGVSNIKAAYGVKSSTTKQSKKLSYDREETDYPHE